jgi:hypothetical protein
MSDSQLARVMDVPTHQHELLVLFAPVAGAPMIGLYVCASSR